MSAGINVMTFQDAVAASDDYNKRHILLGNGFSIACRPDVFRYDKLFEQADFTRLSPSAKNAFAALGTMDFERVIKALRDTTALANAYGVSPKIIEQIEQDADGLKELLVETIAKNHPERPSEIHDTEFVACRAFLDNFNMIYTLNYDLLLYWTKMHTEQGVALTSDDGFRTSQDDIEDGFQSDYVVWEAGQSHGQNIWFLHGALHVFDSGTEIMKYTWNRTGVRLIEQIRNALKHDLFPVFVSEGTSNEKLERIRHIDYLAKAFRSFQEISGCLFIHGHSLAPNDEHFLKLIERGRLSHVFVGLYGKPDSKLNKGIIARANLMATNRSNGKSLKVDFYDSESAHVWS